jgi:exosortase A
MTAVLPIDKAPAAAAEGWRAHLAGLAAAAAAILILFRRDAIGMAEIWWVSATFNHCFLILPLIGWLVWQRLPELRQLAPAAWAPGLVLVGSGAAAWLLGEAGSVAMARHLGLVMMLQGVVVTTLGKAAARGLLFPLCFALFLVPAGEGLVPPLQTLTADMSMALLSLAGVPAHIEGIFITTPTGYFEVAEACSGVRFLVAMAAYGVLVANVCFRTWPRRLMFVAASLIVPVLANGLRAWGTIYVAHLTDNEVAVGVDHIFYGWLFFAIVIALLMGAFWRFFDRRPGDPWFDPRALQGAAAPAGSVPRLIRLAAAAVALAALPPIWAGAIASTAAPAPADIPLPDVGGWSRVEGQAHGRPWQPSFAGADRLRIGRYRDSAGREVDLAVALFARQEEGRELVGYGQGAASEQWSWTEERPAPPRARAERISSHGTVREVVTYYRVGRILTGSRAAVKIETARVRLLGGPQRAVAVMVSAEGAAARPAIDAFLSSLGPVEPLADAGAGLPKAD